MFKNLVSKYNGIKLNYRIAIAIAIGTLLGIFLPGQKWIGEFGVLFVGAMKGIAPILVFILIVNSLSMGKTTLDRRFGKVFALYLISTILASLIAISASFLFPQNLQLAHEASTSAILPKGIGEILNNLLIRAVSNPFEAITQANYIGILGLIHSAIATNGVGIFKTYGVLIGILAGTMFFVTFVIAPMIVSFALKRDPYPLLIFCLKESGITALFTRSSAANIPVNMEACDKLKLDREFYSVSIPLGATINMNGAAITIAIMTLATAHTLGISVDFPTALTLCVVSTIGACGASGIAGGSLFLIPLACSFLGISNDIAMQVVAVGFIIGVVQDSLETALNSSTDVLYTAAAEYNGWIAEGKPLPRRFR